MKPKLILPILICILSLNIMTLYIISLGFLHREINNEAAEDKKEINECK